MSLGVSLLRMNERWEKHRITDEENGCVVASHIPNAIFSIELNCEPSWISQSISRATFATLSCASKRNVE